MIVRLGNLLGIVVLAILNLSAHWNEPNSLLTEEDVIFAETQLINALSSPRVEKPGWQSFNEWHCYLTNKVEFHAFENIWDPETRPNEIETSPGIIASDDTGQTIFDYEDVHFTQESTQSILKVWRALAEGERSICIYAAHLEGTESDSGSWVLSGIKTTKGYWPETRERFFATSLPTDPACVDASCF